MLFGGTLLLDSDTNNGVAFFQAFFTVILILFPLFIVGIFSWSLCTSLRKAFGTFLCHHKEGGAILARWVKLVFSEKGVGRHPP